MALETVVEGLVWVAPADTQPRTARMTIVRLPSGTLWVHAPVAPSAELRRALAELGRVQFVVVPSNRRYGAARSFFDAYPRSELFVAPEVPAYDGALAFGSVLGERAPDGWAGEIEQLSIAGHRTLDEVVFFHRPSRTLVVSDLLGPDRRHLSLPWRGGQTGAPASPRPLSFRDEAAARTAIHRVLGWDFERIARTRGAPVREEAKRTLRNAYARLFDGDTAARRPELTDAPLAHAYDAK